MHKIILQFDCGTIEAELKDTAIAEALYDMLPLSIDLITWGDEAYGSIGKDLGEDNPVPEIPGGGLAYTNNGNYLCFFYGQRPAWAVEYVGQMSDEWKMLIDTPPTSVQITKM